jgi:hypothetical protein
MEYDCEGASEMMVALVGVRWLLVSVAGLEARVTWPWHGVARRASGDAACFWAGAAGIPFRRRREMVVILVALPIFSNGNFFCVTQPRLPVVESSRSPSNLRRCCCARHNTASTGAGAR